MDTNMLPSVQLTKFESNFNHNLFQSSGITHWMSSGKWRESFQSLDDKNNLDALLYPLFTNVFSYFYGQNLTFSRIITKNIRTNIQHLNHFQRNFSWDGKIYTFMIYFHNELCVGSRDLKYISTVYHKLWWLM